MAQTLKEQTTPRGADKRARGPATLTKLERDLRAYELTLAGVTVRGVCDELGIRSTQTAFNAINRGKQYCIDRGIPAEERRIEIDALFKRTLGLLVKTAYDQDACGQIETIEGPDGTIVKTRKGVDPRIVGELSRSLNRWAEFCGLLERAPEVNSNSTTLIQLSSPADGASFSDRWGSTQGGEAQSQPAIDCAAAVSPDA